MGDQKGQRENHEDRPATQATSLRLEPQVLNRGPLGLNAMALVNYKSARNWLPNQAIKA
jgi:hypothetical protein